MHVDSPLASLPDELGRVSTHDFNTQARDIYTSLMIRAKYIELANIYSKPKADEQVGILLN